MVELSGPGARDRSRVGGKAAAIAELERLELPVPASVVLDVSWFGRDDEAFTAALESVLDALGHETTLAVRSSAVDEDGAGASFAGQFESHVEAPATGD